MKALLLAPDDFCVRLGSCADEDVAWAAAKLAEAVSRIRSDDTRPDGATS